MMLIIIQKDLSATEEKMAHQLIQSCHHQDHTARGPYLSAQFNADHTMPSFVYGYEHHVMVGLVAIYADGLPPTQPELAVFVRPGSRRQGIASQLVEQALYVIKKHGYQDWCFWTERAFLDRQPQFLSHFQLDIDPEPEYLLTRQPLPSPLQKKKNAATSWSVRLASTNDLDQLIPIYCEAFDDHDPTSARQYLTGANAAVYIVCDYDQICGATAVDLSDDHPYIFGFFIAAAHRRQGFGRFLLHEVLVRLKQQNYRSCQLSVDGTNTAARRLYEALDFKYTSEVLYLNRRAANSIQPL